jgi:transposase
MHQLQILPQNGIILLAERLVYTMKYTVKDLQVDFPNEDACLKWLVEWLYPNGITCKVCEEVTKHYPIKGRKVYSCGRCGHQISPTAGTIFHKSSTPLSIWYHAFYLMATNKAGTSAKQIERETGVTYKTAWRMMHMIRSMMGAQEGLLNGEVEIDETYIHPNTFKRSSARRVYGYDVRRKGEVVFGMVQRGGAVKVFHVRSAGERVLTPIIQSNVAYGTLIHTDNARVYDRLPARGYEHRKTNHGAGEYYTEDSYTQNIENVWSHFKRGIKGVYRHIGKAYIQNYANEYAWRYSNRNKPSMFWSLMCLISSERADAAQPVSGSS